MEKNKILQNTNKSLQTGQKMKLRKLNFFQKNLNSILIIENRPKKRQFKIYIKFYSKFTQNLRKLKKSHLFIKLWYLIKF